MSKMTRNKHGWVLKCTLTGGFVHPDFSDTATLEQAKVFPTRKRARAIRIPDVDRVRKVSLNKQGVPIKIVKGR